MDDKDDINDYNLEHHSICIVAGANLASAKEMKNAIDYLDKMKTTGYYGDPDGDILLQHIIDYLKSKK